MFASKDALFAKSSGSYQISRSLRFRGGQYLSRTFGTPTDNKKWTWSAWVKIGTINSWVGLFYGGGIGISQPLTELYLYSDGSLYYQTYNGSVNTGLLQTTQVFRDPSAWYHIVLVIDIANATANNKQRIYVNGDEVTAFSTRTNHGTSDATYFNNASYAGYIGESFVVSGTAAKYFDGYMADINFIDGQALTPSSFGAYDTNGVWQPIACTVSDYGKNGFYLPFSDSANIFNDKAAIATNHSAANNWTANGTNTTTPGVTYDWMIDSPTNYADGGNGRGNYAVMNPLAVSSNAAVISNGNLTFSPTPATQTRRQGTIAVSTGKWYFEVAPTTLGGNYPAIGVMLATTNDFNNYIGAEAGTYGYYSLGGVNGGGGGRTYSSYTTTDIIGVAIDCDNSQLTFYKNGANAVTSGTTYENLTAGASYIPAASGLSNAVLVFNFGQQPFRGMYVSGSGSSYVGTGAPPSGFSALNTQNLTTPTITNGAQYMAATTYPGTAATQNIVNSGGFQPDLVWTKRRSVANSHQIFDVLRGVTNSLQSDTTNGDTTTQGALTSFNIDGFTVPNNAFVNSSPDTFVGWQWKGGGTGVSNTSGSITSTVSANTSAGFSVVTYTGTGANATVGHGLGVAPSMILIKDRDSGTNGGAVYHESIGATKYLKLFQAATGTDAAAIDNTVWNGGSPTFNSSVFSIGTNARTNSTDRYVALCWTPIAGYSAFGSYSGNTSTDGPFIYTGFRPRFVMFKSTSGPRNWAILDSSRNTFNVANFDIYANLSITEITQSTVDFLSNGFKLRVLDTDFNASPETYIYAAFCELPFKTSRAR